MEAISEFDEVVELHRTAWTMGLALAWVEAGFDRLLAALDEMEDTLDEYEEDDE